ncbi:MAG: hypothetical protein ABI047_03180 [Jatrophihabitantaceae bacterium]
MPVTNTFAPELKKFLDRIEKQLALRIGVGLDTAQASADAQRLLAEVSAEQARMGAGMDTAEAKAQLQVLAQEISRTHEDVKVGIDKSRISADVADVQSRLSGLASVGRGVVIGGGGAVLAAGIGVAVTQALALVSALAQAAGVAALIPAALVGLAAIGAAGFIGLSGIGAALKDGGRQAAQTGGAVQKSAQQQASAARQVAAAQRGLQAAYENAAESRIQAAERVVDAEANLIASARDELRAQQGLNEARKEAAERIQEFRLQLSGAAVDQQQAALDLAEARKHLADVLADDFSTGLERQAAQVAVDQAQQKVAATAQKYQDLKAESTAANKAGVDGAKNVITAQDSLTDATLRTKEAQKDLTEAGRQQEKDRRDSANAILDAQDRIAQAQEQAANATAAGAAAAGGAANQLQRLSPAGYAVVAALRALGPAWTALRLDVQESLLSGVGDALTRTANAGLPVLRTGLVGISTELNRGVLLLLSFVGQSSTLQAIGAIFANVRKDVAALTPAIQPAAQALLDLLEVGAGFGPGMSAGLAAFLIRISAAVSAAAGDGRLHDFIQGAVTAAGKLLRILANLGSVLVSVFSAGAPSGGRLLTLLVGITGAMAAFLKSDRGQEIMLKVFSTAESAVRLLGNALKGAGPAVAAFFATFRGEEGSKASASIESIKESLAVLGPVLGQAFVSDGVDSLNSVLKIAAVVLRTVASHADTLAKVLPFLAAGFALVKLGQAASNLLSTLDIPLKIAQVVATLASASANRALAASLRAQAATQTASTVATKASTAATQVAVVTTARSTISTLAHSIASKAAAVAAKVWAGAQWLLNAAMSANPIAIIILLIVGLVAGFILAYKHSATFRAIVQDTFRVALKVISAVFSWVKGNWPLLLAILTGPIGLAVLVISRNWSTIREGAAGAVRWITDKFNTVVGFFTGLPGRIGRAAGGLWDSITDSFRAAINRIIDIWNDLEFKIGGQSVFGKQLPGVTIGTPNLPHLGAGATVNPTFGGTLAVLAEAGRPETVVDTGLVNKQLDLTNRLVEKAIAAGRAGDIINNLYLQDQDPVLVAAMVSRKQAEQVA